MLQQALEGIVSRAKREGTLHSRRETSSIVAALIGVYFQVLMFGMIDQSSRSMYSDRLQEQLDIVWDGLIYRDRTE